MRAKEMPLMLAEPRGDHALPPLGSAALVVGISLAFWGVLLLLVI